MMENHESSHIVPDGYLPGTASEALMFAILTELRAINKRARAAEYRRQEKKTPAPLAVPQQRKPPVPRKSANKR